MILIFWRPPTMWREIGQGCSGPPCLILYPNGRTSRVRATFTGATLKVVTNGDRANDFTASFTSFVVPNGTRMIAVLNENLSTQRQGVNERFTLTVREPYQYRNAIIEGHLSGVDRGGRISGRSQMTLDFDRIRMPNGSTYEFAGVIQGVMTNDEAIRVDNEGTLEEESRTSTTLQRTAIGTAIGALIGATAGGGKGAAIGAQ